MQNNNTEIPLGSQGAIRSAPDLQIVTDPAQWHARRKAQTERHAQASSPRAAVNVTPAAGPEAVDAPKAIECTLVTSIDALTKTCGVDAAGHLTKKMAKALYAGTFRRVAFPAAPTEALTDLADVLERLTSQQAIICAPPRAGRNEWNIALHGGQSPSKGSIARTQENFPVVEGPALFAMDFDTAEFPLDLLARIREAGSLSEALASVFEGFRRAAMLGRNSASAGVAFRDKSPKENGQHRYFIVKDGTDIEDFAQRLADRLMLAGFLWGKITATGAVLERTLFDVHASADVSRLFFEADPIIADDRLVSVPRRPNIVSGGMLDTRLLPPLTEEERQRLAVMIRDLKARLAPRAEAIREAYENERIADLITRGRDPESARRTVRGTLETHDLPIDWEIHFDDDTIATVGEILENPPAFDRKTCADPLEPDYNGGRGLAMVLSSHRTYEIKSFAHGGIKYSLAAAYQHFDDYPEDPDEQVRDAPAASSAQEGFHGLKVVTGLVDAAALPVREWLIAPRLPVGDVAQCVGEPGISKSTFALRDALVVATGREDILRGHNAAGAPIGHERLHSTGAVIVYNAEDRLSEMERRLAAAQRHYGVAAAEMKHPIILWSGVDQVTLKVAHRVDNRSPLKRAPGADMLMAAIRHYRAALVVLDPQISLTAGSVENSNDDQDVLLQELARMASDLRCAITVIHHTSKQNRQAAGDMGAGRGGFAAVGKVRSAYTLVNVTGDAEDEKAWGVSRDDGLIRLDYSKISHDRKPQTPQVFRRTSAQVGNGTGVGDGGTAILFDDDPRAALRQQGDHAPVLEMVDLRQLADREKSKQADRGEAQLIAHVIDAIMGDQSQVTLSDVSGAVGEKLREEGLTRAVSRQDINGKIVLALSGDGIAVAHAGQDVRIVMRKTKIGPKAPWVILRETPVLEGGK